MNVSRWGGGQVGMPPLAAIGSSHPQTKGAESDDNVALGQAIDESRARDGGILLLWKRRSGG